MTRARIRFDGWIAGASFASGDAVVVGRWMRSPFGPFVDVMWRRADGQRVLLAATEGVAAFVAGHYTFDEVLTTPIAARVEGPRFRVRADDLDLRIERRRRGTLGWALALRPRILRSSVAWVGAEDRLIRPLVAPLFGVGSTVRTTGTTNLGVREWYAVHDAWTAEAGLSVAGRDAGPVIRGATRHGFGFSDFVASAAVIRVTSTFDVERVGAEGTTVTPHADRS